MTACWYFWGVPILVLFWSQSPVICHSHRPWVSDDPPGTGSWSGKITYLYGSVIALYPLYYEIGEYDILGLAFHSENVAAKQGRGRGHGGGAQERQGGDQGWRPEQTEERLH